MLMLGRHQTPERWRATNARSALLGMLALGAVPSPYSITKASYRGGMYGVQVKCTVYSLPPHQWADVSLSGGPFGPRLISGRAWYEGQPSTTRRLRLSTPLERALKRYRVTLLAVHPATTNASAMLVHMKLPVLGTHRMTLSEVSPATRSLEDHRDLLW